MYNDNTLRSVNVMIYMTPLREGGSLPAIAEADDGKRYVVKFRGAGHGPKGLVAELLGGEIARHLGLPVPELVYAELDEGFGRSEGDEEIQDLLKWSQGLNLGMSYLTGAINYDPVVDEVDSLLASKIVWLDAFITNIDRTARNTNMLIWKKKLWLIDHGASLYFMHNWKTREQAALSVFPMVKDHVLLPWASQLNEVATEFRSKLDEDFFSRLVELIPDSWLEWPEVEEGSAELKAGIVQFFITRLAHSESFLKEANDAREVLI